MTNFCVDPFKKQKVVNNGQLSPNQTDALGDGDFLVHRVNGVETYTPIEFPAELPEYPEEDGAYILTVTMADGEATLSWEAQEAGE